MATETQIEKAEKEIRKKKVLLVIALLLALLLLVLSYFYFRKSGGVITTPLPGRAPGIYHVRSVYGFGKEKEQLFDKPNGVCADERGQLYICDTNNHRIVVMDRLGRNLIKLIGEEGTGTGQILYPLNIAVSEEGLILLVDKFLNKLVLFSSEGKPVKEVDVMIPIGVCYENGNFYVTNYGKVLVYDKNLNKLKEFGKRGSEVGQFDHPGGIAVAGEKIYVADSFNLRFVVLDKNLKPLFSVGKLPKSLQDKERIFGLPASIAVDNRGYIYVLDAFNAEILVFNSKGEKIASFGQMGNKEGELFYPSCIFYKNGLFYVADKYNNRIQILEIVPE